MIKYKIYNDKRSPDYFFFISIFVIEIPNYIFLLANRISSLVEVGILSVLFDCLTKMAANVSILQNDTLSVNTLALCHVLIAKVAPKGICKFQF